MAESATASQSLESGRYVVGTNLGFRERVNCNCRCGCDPFPPTPRGSNSIKFSRHTSLILLLFPSNLFYNIIKSLLNLIQKAYVFPLFGS